MLATERPRQGLRDGAQRSGPAHGDAAEVHQQPGAVSLCGQVYRDAHVFTLKVRRLAFLSLECVNILEIRLKLTFAEKNEYFDFRSQKVFALLKKKLTNQVNTDDHF